MAHSYSQRPLCGLFYVADNIRKYIPQVKMAAHATILSSVARTKLTQTFENTDPHDTWNEVKYTFPLVDGVSIVAFTCTIGDRVIKGVVKEKQKAREVYEEARDRGSRAALLEQVTQASDVFLTSIGNVPPKTKVLVEVTYLGELAHDAEVDGIRGTIPTVIAPRYGDWPAFMRATNAAINTAGEGGLEIIIDAQVPAGSTIKSIQSPSHPISVSIGTLSTAPDAEASLQNASASLSLPRAELEKDFVIQVVATNTSNPVAMLETHPTLPNERALMATLVPKFALPPERPEVVFVCDRSGSMRSNDKIGNLRTALQIFLKSLPVGVKFNICSFGNQHLFLWEQSRTYDKASLEEATRHVETFAADMGGTEMYPAVKDVFERRYSDMNLEVLLLTDGAIWSPDQFFQLIRSKREESKNAIRLFSLAIGSGSSSSLTEGAARAGNGFSQSVGDKEKMNSKVVRMLKAALSPHISDYTLEVKYEAEQGSDDDFELVEKVEDCLLVNEQAQSAEPPIPQKTTSLFDPSVDFDTVMGNTGETEDKFDHLPTVTPPKLLQAPFEIPPLYPFNRTSVYMLMSNETIQRPVKSVVLRATSRHGPLELEIPVTTLDEPGETIHQLAARKAVKELEEGAGWMYHAKDADHNLLKEKHSGRFSDMVEREAVRLGVKYQVGGKWSSFVAVEENRSAGASDRKQEIVNPSTMIHASTQDPSKRARGDSSLAHARIGFGGIHQYQKAFGAGLPPPPPPPQVSLSAAPPPPQFLPKPPNVSLSPASPPARGTSSFGASPTYLPPGGLFGAAPQARQAQPFGSSSSVFGAPPSQSPSGSAFGAPPSHSPSGGLFGAAPQAQTPLFGGVSGAPPSQSPSGGLFGAAPQAQPAPLFGSGSSAPPPHSPSGGLFGAAPQARQAQSSNTGGTSTGSFSSPIDSSRAQLGSPLKEITVVKERGEKFDSLDSLSYASPVHTPARRAKASIPDNEERTVKPGLPTDKLEALVSLQGFDGSWPSSENVFHVIGVSQQDIEEALRARGTDWSEGLVQGGADIVATAGVLAFLKVKLGGQEEEWEMIGDKGWDWLVGAVPALDGSRGDFEACLAGLFN